MKWLALALGLLASAAVAQPWPNPGPGHAAYGGGGGGALEFGVTTGLWEPADGNGSITTPAFSGAITAGSTVLVFCALNSNNATDECTDVSESGDANNYVQISGCAYDGVPATGSVTCWIATNHSGGIAPTLSATFTANTIAHRGLMAVEIKSADTSDSYDKSDWDHNGSANWGTPATDIINVSGCCSVTPAQDGSAVVAWVYYFPDDDGVALDYTAGTGFSLIGMYGVSAGKERFGLEGVIQTTATSVAAKWTYDFNSKAAAGEVVINP